MMSTTNKINMVQICELSKKYRKKIMILKKDFMIPLVFSNVDNFF